MCLLAKNLAGCQGFPGRAVGLKKVWGRCQLSWEASSIFDRGQEGFHLFSALVVGDKLCRRHSDWISVGEPRALHKLGDEGALIVLESRLPTVLKYDDSVTDLPRIRFEVAQLHWHRRPIQVAIRGFVCAIDQISGL